MVNGYEFRAYNMCICMSYTVNPLMKHIIPIIFRNSIKDIINYYFIK